MEDKLLSHAIPGSITETGSGDVLEKGVGINDGLGRLRGVLLEFAVNTPWASKVPLYFLQ